MSNKYVLALDQGTTSSRSILFGHDGTSVASAQEEFEQIFPEPGQVEHDPEAIWKTQYETVRRCIDQSAGGVDDIASIGITNQRETTILWDRHTGKPVANALVWQSRVSAGICDRLKADGLEATFREKTGLVVDAYFSGTKIKHLLDSIDGLRARAEAGDILFGTVDTYLLWRLTGGKCHATDVSNASRTLLFNLHTLEWDDELLGILRVPRAMLPEVKSSSEVYGETTPDLFGRRIPIAGIAGDQQAATFGQACFSPGDAKNTYGTGCFMLLNIGETPVLSKSGMLTTVGWSVNGKVTYCLEGSIFVGGAVVQWLRDGLQIIEQSEEVEQLAMTVPDNGGVYLVPAFVGLGAPYWDQAARGTLVGLTRGTNRGHIARAALESIAFQSLDVLTAMEQDASKPLETLKVDGGAANNNLMMQFQADLLGVPVRRPVVPETTALGAAYLAGLAVGFWKDQSDIVDNWAIDRQFEPEPGQLEIKAMYSQWKRAVERSRDWAQD